MGVIVPAILPTSRADLEEKLAKLAGKAENVQVDIVDGHFAAPASWPYSEDPAQPGRMAASGEMMPGVGNHRIELDLMSIDPESTAGTWIEVGATRIVIHAESTRYLGRLIDNLHTVYGHDQGFASDLLSVGLALGMKTDASIIEPYLSKIDFVQFMGIDHAGHQGEHFDRFVLPKISAFRKKHPKVPVQVDGGVSLHTAPALLDLGVSRLVVGSALWRAPDFDEAYEQFLRITEEHGIYERQG